MSNGRTARLPVPGYRERRRRPGRWLWVLLASLLTLLVLLVVADRVTVAYAENQAAAQMTRQGFPARPAVTIEGFPFLTQLLARRLADVHVTASNVPAGPVTLTSITADATGVRLGPGFRTGTVTQVTGTGLIDFASLASAAGIPGLTVSAAGPHSVKLTVLAVSAVAGIKLTGPQTLLVHITSAGGLPGSLLGSLQNFRVHIPALPLGLAIQGVSVSSQGVVIAVTGSNIPFHW
jgi:hypothetical protein